MTSATSLMAKHLGEAKKGELISELLRDINSDTIDVLIELLSDFNLELHNEVFKQLYEFVFNNLLNCDVVPYNLKLIKCVGRLRSDILDRIASLLSIYIVRNRGYFQVDPEISVKQLKVEVEHVDVIMILDFLDSLFMDIACGESLDELLIKLLGINDDVISSKASKLLRWRITNIVSNHTPEYIYGIISSLNHSNIKYHQNHGFILWLRYLTTNPSIQSIIEQDSYWSMLQSGLISEVNEHRKYSLSILQLSLKVITSSFNNQYISWDMNNSQQYLLEWSRYIALFEIVGIDTSLHQAEAARQDIINLISTDCLIYPSWGWCLISIGLRATMDSVRKFIMRLILDIPRSNLHLIKHGLSFLTSIMLPNLMLASNLIVKNVEGVDKCEYIDQLVNFVSGLVESGDCEISLAVLKTLENLKDSFDPARIAVVYGLMKGLQGKQVLKFGIHDECLVKLFEVKAEGEIFQTCCLTINLRLLLNFKLETTQFLHVLNKFVKFNGFNLIHENLNLLQDYIKDVDFVECLKNEPNIDHQVLLIGLSGQKVETSSLLQVKLLQAGFTRELPLDVNLEDLEIVRCLSSIDHTPPTDDKIIELWNQLELEVQSKDYYQLTQTLYKFRLFNIWFKNSELKFPVIDMHKVLLVHSDLLSQQVKHFYKLKDEIMGEYYYCLQISISKQPVSFEKVFSIMDSNSTDFKSNISMVETIKQYLDSEQVDDINDIVELLTSMWFNLEAGRLQLNQKNLHILLIQTLFHPVILNKSSNEFISSLLVKFSHSVIINGTTRRSLLPELTKCILNYSKFEQLSWLVDILIDAFLVYQLRNNSFRLESIIAKLYDEQISLTTNDIYAQVYGDEEISTRVNLMAIFNSITNDSYAQLIYDTIVTKHRELFNIVNNVDSIETWNRIQLWTIILSIIDKINIDYQLVLDMISADKSPLVRIYLEWVLSYKLFSNNNEEIINQLFSELSSGILTPTIIISYEKILYLLIKQSPNFAHLNRLLNIIIPGSTSNKALTRHFSLSLIMSIHDNANIMNVLTSETQEILDNIYNSTMKSESINDHKTGDALLWDIVQDFTLCNLSGGLILNLYNREDTDYILPCQYTKYLSQQQITRLNYPIGELFQEEQQKQHIGKKISKAITGTPLQTKSGAWTTVMDVDDQGRQEIVRSDLIVVSSLVDKPPNLGGICRLCDVLGVGTLTLNDLTVINHPQFKNVAVTADHWMPMIEVKLEDIKQYLLDKKKQGYTLIGLEQTTESIELNNKVEFPSKSLILLGREREGIPGDLLAELDLCIEIKQVGVIRSMNIQTATAIIVHAYSSQHC